MNRKTDNNLIKIYNEEVRNREKTFGGKKGSNPYFTIDINTLKKLSLDEIKIWESARIEPDKFVFNRLWSEIFEKNRRKFIPTLKEKELKLLNKKIKFNPKTLSDRINVQNIWITEKIHDYKTLRSHCNNRGFELPPFHLKWLIENNLLHPILEKDGIKYYSQYQLYLLLYIENRKQLSLEYPNPFYFEGELFGSKPILWQDFLLLNRESIDAENTTWNKIVELILDIRDLDICFFNAATEEIGKIQPTGPMKSKPINDLIGHYAAYVGRVHAEKIKSKHKISEEHVGWWITKLTDETIRLNPLVKKADEWPIILKLSREHESRFSQLGKKSGPKNPIQLSNWLLTIIQYLAFYLYCISGEKHSIPEIIDLVVSGEIQNKKRCEICNELFIPNPFRSGGKEQKICGDPACEAKRNQKYMRNYRKNKKINM